MQQKTELTPGICGERTDVVNETNTAAARGSGLLPVYSTPAMIGLMEGAAVAALDGRLPEGASSVGTEISIRHLSATPLGMNVRARAELIKVEERKLGFKVEAFDDAGKIGEGHHERFIIDIEKFMQRTQKKQ